MKKKKKFSLQLINTKIMRFENLPDINISMYKTKTAMDKELQNVTKCLSTYIHKLKFT